MKYKVHKFPLIMTQHVPQLEQFLNSLSGEVIAIIPNVDSSFYGISSWVNFLLIVEKIKAPAL